MIKTGLLGGALSILMGFLLWVGVSLTYSFLSDTDPKSGMLIAGIAIILIPVIGAFGFVGTLVVTQFNNYLKTRKEIK